MTKKKGPWFVSLCCLPFANGLSFWTQDSDGVPKVILDGRRVRFCPYCGAAAEILETEE